MLIRLAGVVFLILSAIGAADAQSMPWYLTSQFPASNSTGIPTNVTIQLTEAPAVIDGPPSYTLSAAGQPPVALQQSVFIPAIVLAPSAPLTPQTRYTFTITPNSSIGIPYSFSFTTGNGPDSTPPHLIGFNPPSGTMGLGVQGPIIAQFDKPLSLYSIYTRRGGISGNPFSPVGLTPDLTGIVLEGSSPGNWTSILDVTVDPTQIQDAFGNYGQGPPQSAEYFTFTAPAGSTAAPSLLSFFPADGAQGLPVNVSIRLLFDRPVDFTTAAAGISLTSNGVAIPTKFALFAGGSGIALQPANLLAPNQTFQVTTGPGLHDSLGLPIAQTSSFQFTTAGDPDVTAAQVVYIGPLFGSPSPWPVNAVLSLRVNKPIMPLATVEFNHLSSGYGFLPPIPAVASLSPDGQTFTLTPTSPLVPAAVYSVDLNDLVDVTGGQFYAGTVSFTTGTDTHTTIPSVLAATPPDGTQGLPVTSPIKVLFSERMGVPQAGFTLTAGGRLVNAQFIMDDSDTLLTVTPAALSPNTSYTLSLNGLTSLTGESIAPFVLNFSTGSAPAQPGYVSLLSSSPAQGATGVDVNTQIVATFDAPLAPLAAFTGITVSDPITGVYPATGSLDGNTLTITVGHPLLQNTLINVNVSAFDVQGRPCYCYLSFQTGSNTDRTPFQVTGVFPPSGASIFLGSTPITLTFNKAINAASLSAAGALGAYGDGAPLSVLAMRTNQDKSLTLTLQGGNGGDELTLLASSALTDLAGNPLVPFRATYNALPPAQAPVYSNRVLLLRPSAGVTGIPADTPITLFLIAPVDLDTVKASLVITADGTPVPGEFLLSPDGTILTFVHTSPFPAGSTIRFYQRSPIFDDTYGMSFTVAATNSATPVLLRYVPNGNMPANSVIELQFSGTVSATQSLATLFTSLSPYGVVPGLQVPATASNPRPGVIRLTPSTPLTAGDYVIGLANTVGNPFASTDIRDILFHATPPVPEIPAVPVPSPPANASGIGVNASISVSFGVPLNALSIVPDNITIQANLVNLPVQLFLVSSGNGFLATPSVPLPPNTTVYVTVAGIEDFLGNPVPSVSWNFSTGPVADFTPQALVSTSIPAATGNVAKPQVPPNQPILLVFNRPMIPGSLLTPQVTLNPPASLDVSWSADLQTLILTPNPPLYQGQTYSLGSFQLLDIYGNSVTASLPPFETLFDADTTLPNLVALSPGDGQTGLPLNAQIIANFDKPIDPTSFGGIQLLAGSTPVPLVLEPNEFNRVRFAPVDPLVPNTTYTVVVSGVKDLSGNVMAGTVTRSFVTGAVLDSVPPNMLTLLNPAPNLSIRFVFSKPVSPATVDSKSLVLSRASNNLSSWFWIPVSATVSLSADGLTATLTPNAPLTPNWRHEVVALNIRDFAGNSLSSSSTTHEDFSTSSSPDVTAPVIAVTPPDASTGVPLTTPIAAITLETVLPPPSSPAALQLSTGGQPVPGAVSFDGRGLTFTPSSPLLPGTTYRMDVVSLTDLAGNASAPVSSTFTTAATGSAVAPYFQLVSSSPANGDAGVDSNAPIVLTFNSPINAATMNYIGILTPFPTPGIFTASGNTVTFTPSEPWGSAVAVGIRMNTYVQNLYGTPLPYMNIGFLTVATSGGITPQLLSTSPPVGSTLVPTQGDFRLTFNETVAAPTGAMIFFNGSQQTAISPTYDVNDFHTLTFSAGISANSQVTITGSDAIADRFGNPIVPFTLQYATGPLPSFDGPSVAQVSPVRQAQNVNPATPIVLQFNDSLDPQSALASIRVTQNGVAITGQLVLSNANQTVQFTPDQPYSPGARIDVLVLETLVDATGITYGGHYDSWFTVAGGSSAPAAASQVSFGSMVAPTAALELAFDQPLDGSTATSANVWLRSGHRVIPAAVSLRNGGRIVRLIPAAPLDEGSSYALTVGPGLLTTGGAQVRPEEFHFEASTADKAAEVESAVMETVGQIPAIHLHFAAPVSPLSADAASLIRADGTEAAVTRRISVDCMDLWLIPGASEPDIQALSVSLTGLEDRAGRPVARWKGAIVTRKSQ